MLPDSRIKRIQLHLENALKATYVHLRDDSHKHAGHVHGPSGGDLETHLFLTIESPELTGLSRIKQHQKIYNLLKDEFQNGLHALQIKVIST